MGFFEFDKPKITRIIGLLKLNIIECIADLGLRNNTYNKNKQKRRKNSSTFNTFKIIPNSNRVAISDQQKIMQKC